VAARGATGERPDLARFHDASSGHTGGTSENRAHQGGRVSSRIARHGVATTWRFARNRRRAPAHDNTQESPTACFVSGNVGRIFFCFFVRQRRPDLCKPIVRRRHRQNMSGINTRRGTIDVYGTREWPALCEAVRCLKGDPDPLAFWALAPGRQRRAKHGVRICGGHCLRHDGTRR
jgi:hypothetical protein